MVTNNYSRFSKFARNVVGMSVREDQPDFVFNHKRLKMAKSYVYKLECGHTMVQRSQLAGNNKLKNKIICEYCEAGE